MAFQSTLNDIELEINELVKLGIVSANVAKKAMELATIDEDGDLDYMSTSDAADLVIDCARIYVK